MECTLEGNKAGCSCTYDFGKRGRCSKCVAYQGKMKQIPECFFTKESERTYDRSYHRYMMENKYKFSITSLFIPVKS